MTRILPRSILGKILITLLLLPILCLLLVFGALQTPPAKGLIVTSINALNLGQLQVEIADLRGFLPFNIQLGRVNLSDSKGGFFQARDLAVDISWWRLGHKTLAIDLLQAKSITLSRLPDLPQSKERSQDQETSPSAPGLPLGLSARVNKLNLPSLQLGSEVLGHPVTCAVDSSLALTSMDSWRATLNLRQVDRQGLDLRLAASAQGSTPDLHMDLSVQDMPGGLVLSQIPLPFEHPVQFTLQGDGPLTDWTARLHLLLGQEALATSDLHLGLKDSATHLGMHSKIMPLPILPQKLSTLSHLLETLDLDLTARFQPKEQIVHLTGLELDCPLGRVDLQGRAEMASRQVDLSAGLHLGQVGHLAPLLEQDLSGALDLNLQARGSMDAPQLDLQMQALDLDLQGMSLQQASLNLTSRLRGTDAQSLSRLPVQGQIKTSSLIVDQSPVFSSSL